MTVAAAPTQALDSLSSWICGSGLFFQVPLPPHPIALQAPLEDRPQVRCLEIFRRAILLLPHQGGPRGKPDSQAGGQRQPGYGHCYPTVLRAFWELWNSTGNWVTRGQQWGPQGLSCPLCVTQDGQRGPDLPEVTEEVHSRPMPSNPQP